VPVAHKMLVRLVPKNPTKSDEEIQVGQPGQQHETSSSADTVVDEASEALDSHGVHDSNSVGLLPMASTVASGSGDGNGSGSGNGNVAIAVNGSGSGSGSEGGKTGFQGHLHKMRDDLLDIIGQMSHSPTATPRHGNAGSVGGNGIADSKSECFVCVWTPPPPTPPLAAFRCEQNRI
jgi:hypothetical protein